MYDASGRFSFEMGFPCKSGIAGSLLIVIPGVCGVCTFSPRVDTTGNSVRGLQFCHLLSRKFKFHSFADLTHNDSADLTGDTLVRAAGPIDPRRDDTHTNYGEDLIELMWAASDGDVQRARMMLARSVDVNAADYDARTALHVGSANGHVDVVGFLLGAGADPRRRDRFGHTPLEAVRGVLSSVKDDELVGTKGEEAQGEAVGGNSRNGKSLLSVISLLQPLEGKIPLSAANVSNLPDVLLKSLDPCFDGRRDGYLTRDDIVSALVDAGIDERDPRVHDLLEALPRDNETPLNRVHMSMVTSEPLVVSAIQGRLVVPDWPRLCTTVSRIRASIAGRSGTIPFGVSVMSVSGQSFSCGESDVYFSVDALSRPINFAIALEDLGFRECFHHIGCEPSGKADDAFELDTRNVSLGGKIMPHNCCTTAGAIMCAALLRPELPMTERQSLLRRYWSQLTGGRGTDETLAEEAYASRSSDVARDRCLLYMMEDAGALPDGTDVAKTLEMYLRSMCLQQNTRAMASVAATLANGGVNPTTGIQVFKPSVAQAVLSLMFSCGMDEVSGEFAFTMGFPSKSSGKSGALMICIPNVCGICTWSKHVDHQKRSPFGMEFCRRFSNEYQVHNIGKAIKQFDTNTRDLRYHTRARERSQVRSLFVFL
jgi:glutaminase